MSEEEKYEQLRQVCLSYRNEVADLEAKLAELREQITICNEENSKTFMKSVNAWRENAELKQRLAEKDDELLQKEKKIQDLMLCEFVATTLDFNKLSADNCKLREKLAEHNQDKLSLAVEQIIKTKETLIKFLQDEGFYENVWYDLFDKIDNQIKQLKEMK